MNSVKSKAKQFVPLKQWQETHFSCPIRQRPLSMHASTTRHILIQTVPPTRARCAA